MIQFVLCLKIILLHFGDTLEYKHKDLVGLKELTKEEILYFLDSAVEFKKLNKSPIKKADYKGEGIVEMADIAIIDEKKEYVYDETINKSKSKNFPLYGKKVVGANVCTLKNGKVVFELPNVIYPQ